MDNANPRVDTPSQTVDKAGRIRIAIAAVSVLLVVVTAFVAVRYFFTRAPIQTDVPILNASTLNTPPRYQFSIYGMNFPLAVAATADGTRIYVTESEGPRNIILFDRTGKEIHRFAPPNTQPGTRAPVFVAVNDNKVYVSDRLRHSIDIFDLDGNYVGAITPPDGAKTWSPMGIAFDRSGNLLVTDLTKGAHRLLVLDTRGNTLKNVGTEGSEEGQFSYPNSIATDSQGKIFVADGNNGRIQILDSKGELTVASTTRLGLPRGMAIDGQNRLYVTDATAHSISVYDVNGGSTQPLYSFGSQGFEDGRFNYPNGLAVDGTGKVYIADRVNQRVQVWLY